MSVRNNKAKSIASYGYIISKQINKFKQINRNFKLAAYKQKQGAKWAAFVSSPILVVELWRSAATGTKVSIACPQSSECIQQEQVTQLQLHLHFISAKRVNCLHHFLAQYFTRFQLILLQRLEICYSQRLEKVSQRSSR